MTSPDETPTPQTNPYTVEFPDYRGKLIRITVTFNETTRALTGATGYRDADCQYKRIYIGTGDDGTPDGALDVVPVPAGTSTVTANQLRRNSLRTIEDVLALQITAGP